MGTANGIAQTNNLQALLEIGNVAASGTANLVNQALKLRVNVVLSKEFSQQVGGTGIGGYMNTALANNQGELVIPVMVTGTLQHPVFIPDLQKVAQKKLKGLVPNFSNPKYIPPPQHPWRTFLLGRKPDISTLR